MIQYDIIENARNWLHKLSLEKLTQFIKSLFMYHVSHVHSTNLSKYTKKYIQPPSPTSPLKESQFSGTCKMGIVLESYPELYTES